MPSASESAGTQWIPVSGRPAARGGTTRVPWSAVTTVFVVGTWLDRFRDYPLLQAVILFPQTLINVRLPPGHDWKSSVRLASETRQVEAELAGSGRVLIRASGTEPVLRVMVEARYEQQARSCAERLVQAVQAG